MQNSNQNRKRSRILLISIVLMSTYYCLFYFLRDQQFDSNSYVSGVKLLFNLDGGEDIQSRVSKPLSLILPGALHLFFGLKIATGFLIQNALCFCALMFLIYNTFLLLFNDEVKANYALWIYFTLPPIAIFSMFVLTDITGWVFILIPFYILLRSRNQKWNPFTLYVFLGFIVGLGGLFKESSFAGGILVFFYILFSEETRKVRVWYILIFASTTFIFLLIGMLFTKSYDAQSLLSRQSSLFSKHGLSMAYSLENISQIYRVFDLFWIPLVIGVIRAFKKGFKKWDRIMLFSSFSILLILPFVHANAVHDRILMMVAPFLLYFCIQGFFTDKRINTVIICLFALLNISGAFMIYRFDAQNILIGNLTIGIGVYVFFSLFKPNQIS